MDRPIEITVGNTYIFKGKNASNDFVKYKILEITDTTYLVKNMDTGIEFRVGIVNFNNDYKPIELLTKNLRNETT